MTQAAERRPGKPHLVASIEPGFWLVWMAGEIVGGWQAKTLGMWPIPKRDATETFQAMTDVSWARWCNEWRRPAGAPKPTAEDLNRIMRGDRCPLCARPTHDGAPCSPYQSLRDLRKSHPELFV